MAFFTSDILGMNARNLMFIHAGNKRSAIRIADDKLLTKKVLRRYDIPVQPTYAVLRTSREIKEIDLGQSRLPMVIKPAHGLGGGGIVVIDDAKEEKGKRYFIDASGDKWSEKDLRNHMRDVIDGNYSLSGLPDVVFIEKKVVVDPAFRQLTYKGLPDIRVIVYNRVPVIAMLRLATKFSHGKANMQQGGISVAIDISTGITTTASCKKPYRKQLEKHPDTGHELRGFQIPYWNEILEIAVRCQEASGLGYMGADIVIDKQRGPLVLEINARPGLEIQNVNQTGLRRRLERVRGLRITSVEQGIKIAKDLFGDVVEKEMEDLSGKHVIGLKEPAAIVSSKGKRYQTLARVDTGATLSGVDRGLAEKAGYAAGNDDLVEVTMHIGQEKIVTKVKLTDLADEKAQIILGQKDLKRFIIDSSKQYEVAVSGEFVKQHAEDVDSLIKIARRVSVDSAIKPINSAEEEKKFFQSHDYNPVFKYKVDRSIEMFILPLTKLEFDSNTVTGTLAEKKRRELINMIKMILAAGTKNFSKYSELVYGVPDGAILGTALQKYKQHSVANSEPSAYISMAEAEEQITSFLMKRKIDYEVIKTDDAANRISVSVIDTKVRVRLSSDSKGFLKREFRGKIAHEIETHVYRALNGMEQPYKILHIKCAGYKMLDEGLAIYNQHQYYDDSHETILVPPFLALMVDLALRKSFREVYQFARGVENEAGAWIYTMRVKRGLGDTSLPGSFTKDSLYYRGEQTVREYLRSGGDLSDLYYGRYGLDDVQLIKKLKKLRPPKYLPERLE